ncbi:unnamed protein product [Gongylonema pulchrum]|uniref:Carboxypeptidase n=1 Tax=Gongylonema pulchrum TaxID=637853 RepID=A0A183CXE4_9BILA|nr:unnamed protein product [Gongylonema pulchrum]
MTIFQRKQGKEPWKFAGQIAGFKTQYKGLTFLTVRGAGHMAPQWRAPQMQFIKSEHDPNKDPLLFWYNGGPGCSSLYGLLREIGPYLVNDDGKTLRRNAHAWTKVLYCFVFATVELLFIQSFQVASVVFVESPVGVGFSYDAEENNKNSDDQTARENYAAVKAFYQEFPWTRSRPLYLAGESYAAIYISMLAELILLGQSGFPVLLEGIAIGNGYLSREKQIDTMLRYAHAHGLIGRRTWNLLEEKCCPKCPERCSLGKSEESACSSQVDLFPMSVIFY